MSMARIIAIGAMILVVMTIAEYACADMLVRPPRPDSFKSDEEVRLYMQKLRAFLDKGASRYGKRNTYSAIDTQSLEQPIDETNDRSLVKEYPDPSVQHSQHRYYPEWFKQVSSRPNKGMWY